MSDQECIRITFFVATVLVGNKKKLALAFVTTCIKEKTTVNRTEKSQMIQRKEMYFLLDIQDVKDHFKMIYSFCVFRSFSFIN